MFKKLFEKTKVIAAISEIEGQAIGSSIQKLADEFEDKYFEYQFEQFAEAKHLSPEDRTLLAKELLDRIDRSFESIREQELKPQTQAIVIELVEIQKKLNALKAKIEELKATKTDLSQPVIDALNELNLQSIRVGKVLVSLYQGRTPASFKAVIEAIETKLTPAVAKLLRDTYEKLSSTREPEVRVKVESKSGDWAARDKKRKELQDKYREDMKKAGKEYNLPDLLQIWKEHGLEESVDEDLLTGIADFFGNAFRKLLGNVSNALTNIEQLLGGRVKEDELDPHKIEKNKPAPVVFGLG